MKGLSQRGILVNLKITLWSARKLDKEISLQVDRNHNAINGGRYNKILIAEEELKEVQRSAGAARAFLYKHTLPWEDNGNRLLPATNYLEFINQFKDHKSSFEVSASRFVKQYPKLRAQAKKRLNGLFDETDYPSIADITRKFAISVSFMQISDLTDFRLQVDQKNIASLKTQIESETYSRITEATKNIYQRMKEAISHMVEKLTTDDAKFHNSMVTNIKELIDFLPRLNFTNDPDISDLINAMNALVVDPENLREDNRFRNETAQKASDLLAKINDFLG